MRKVVLASLTVALALSAGAASARGPDEILCNDAEAVSGDSLACGGGVIRLHGVTSPAADTEAGEAARRSLQRMIRLRETRCLVRDHLSNRLDVASCYVNGRSLADRQLRAGHAAREARQASR